MMKRIRACLLPFVLCYACSSGNTAAVSDPSAAPDTAQIRAMLAPLAQGDYEGFVAHLASCNNQPESYRRQMAMACKQRFSAVQFRDFRISRIEMPRDSVAEVFVIVEMPQGKEEILLRLVHTERGWQFR